MTNTLDIDTLGLAPTQLGATRAPNETTLQAQATTALSPRFYTTDFAKMNRMSVDPVRAEWDGLVAELAADTNRKHFVRTAEWDVDPDKLPEPLRKEFVDFLVSSLTSEFSGCVLYAEMRKRGTNPDLCTLFKYMSRDESRHAGFINDSLRDFGVQVDMSFLVKTKKYTFFPAEIHPFRDLPLREDRLRALHQNLSASRATSGKSVSSDLQNGSRSGATTSSDTAKHSRS